MDTLQETQPLMTVAEPSVGPKATLGSMQPQT